MRDDVAYLESIGARDIRINQQQLNTECRVGICRPDVQAIIVDPVTKAERRIIIEYDTSASTRGAAHATRSLANDPRAIVILRRVN